MLSLHEVNEQITLFDFGLVLDEGLGGWAKDHLALGTEMTIMAGTDILLNILCPFNPASQMGAHVRENGHGVIAFANHICSVAVDGFLPAIDL
jgi:hypothetical protein